MSPTSEEHRLALSRAVNRLCEAILRAETTSEMLQSLVDIAGPVLRADRAHIYDVRYREGVAAPLVEWIGARSGAIARVGPYALADFGNRAEEFAQREAPIESSLDAVDDYLRSTGADRVLHGQRGVKRALAIPLHRRADGYFVLSLHRVFTEEPWSAAERSFVHTVGAHVELGLMKLDLLRERERAANELREAERRLRAFYDATPSMFFAVDRAGTVRALNHYAVERLGYDSQALVGGSVLRVVHPDDRDAVAAHLAASFDEPGRVREISFRKVRRDGTIMWVRELLRVAEGPDGETAFIACDDVTEARANAEAARQAESRAHDRDEFMAMLGHELRNPLAPIVTALDILRRRGRDDEEIELIDRQVSHLRRLVDDLLDISRITRGRVELNQEPIELAVVAAQAIEVAQPFLDGRRQSIQVDVAPRGLLVLADRTRLVQALVNLLHNAAKFSGEGQTVYLSAARREDRVVVAVRDEGEGIAPEMLGAIFDLFEQRAQRSDRVQSGLGLGLTIVRNLVELHGGSVRAHSAGRGHGSTIELELPLADESSVAIRRHSGGTSDAIAGDHSERCVLVVDDNDDVRRSLCNLLELYGYPVVGVGDGPAALQAAETLLPRVVLIDIGLPGMDGYTLARELLRRHPAGPQLVAISGYGQPSDRARSAAAGFAAHLVKPIDIDHLLPWLGAGADAALDERESR